MVDTQHESSLCIQIMIGKLVYLSFYDPQCGRRHRHHTPISTPCFPSTNDKPRHDFVRTLMSSEVAPHYLLPSLDCSITTSPRAQISWIVSSSSLPMLIAGRAFHDADARLLFSRARWKAGRDGDARWMGRGSRLARCPHSETIRMNPLRRQRTKEGECRVAGVGCIWFPTRILIFFLCKPETTCFNRYETCLPCRPSSY